MYQEWIAHVKWSMWFSLCVHVLKKNAAGNKLQIQLRKLNATLFVPSRQMHSWRTHRRYMQNYFPQKRHFSRWVRHWKISRENAEQRAPELRRTSAFSEISWPFLISGEKMCDAETLSVSYNQLSECMNVHMRILCSFTYGCARRHAVVDIRGYRTEHVGRQRRTDIFPFRSEFTIRRISRSIIFPSDLRYA